MRYLFLVFIFIGPLLHGQLIDQQVVEEVILIDGISTAVQNAKVVGETEEFRDIWRKFCKEEFDVKVNRKGDVLMAEKVVINRITDRRGDLILFMYPLEKEVSFNIGFRLGYDVYLNKKEFPDEAQNLKDFTVYFINYYYYQYLEDYIKDQESNLRDIQKEYKSASSAVSKADKSVKKLEKKIAKNESRLEKMEGNLAETADEKKAEARISIEDLKAENRGYKQEILNEKAPVGKYQSMIKLLEPKIKSLEEQLDQNRMMYIEARDRIKR